MTQTFTKLSSSITESTIWQETAETRIVWITLLAMCDRHGEVHSSIPGLASRAKVSLEQTEIALSRFLAPDKYSRTKDHEGRRIREIKTGGWLLLNHAKYRDMRDDEARREYNAAWMRRKRQSEKSVEIRGEETSTVDSVDSGGSPLAHADADADADPLKDRGAIAPLSAEAADRCPHSEIVNLYHRLLPELRSMRSWDTDRQKMLRARWKEDKRRQDIGWWERYFNYVRGCPLLMGKVESRSEDGVPWQADLEWLVRPKNLRKVLERKYEERDSSRPQRGLNDAGTVGPNTTPRRRRELGAENLRMEYRK